MKGITVRFGDSSYALIRNEARKGGVTMSAFIREAAMVRASLALARRGGPIPYDNAALKAIRDYLEAERIDRLNGD